MYPLWFNSHVHSGFGSAYCEIKLNCFSATSCYCRTAGIAPEWELPGRTVPSCVQQNFNKAEFFTKMTWTCKRDLARARFIYTSHHLLNLRQVSFTQYSLRMRKADHSTLTSVSRHNCQLQQSLHCSNLKLIHTGSRHMQAFTDFWIFKQHWFSVTS